MTERWFFSVDCAEMGIRRIEAPWSVVSTWRRFHLRISGFYPTPFTDGVSVEYAKNEEGNFESIWSPWQMRADVIHVSGYHRRHRGHIYRACRRPGQQRCCLNASLLGETCPAHRPRAFLPGDRAALQAYLATLPARSPR